MDPRDEAWTPGPAWLFCPADRPERYGKALAAADVVIFDLEDAVAPERRDGARLALREALSGLGADRHIIRVNPLSSPEHAADVALVRDLGARAMVAKCEGPSDLVHLDGIPAIPLIETARGLVRVHDIADARGVIGLMWGADDLVASIGGSASRSRDGRYRDTARLARATVLIAAKAAELLAIDNVVMAIDDPEPLAREVDAAVADGFDVKVAIHPRQVAVIREGFAPTGEQMEWATRVLTESRRQPGVFRLDGRMVDGPIIKQAERTLSRRCNAVPGASEG